MLIIVHYIHCRTRPSYRTTAYRWSSPCNANGCIPIATRFEPRFDLSVLKLRFCSSYFFLMSLLNSSFGNLALYSFHSFPTTAFHGGIRPFLFGPLTWRYRHIRDALHLASLCRYLAFRPYLYN